MQKLSIITFIGEVKMNILCENTDCKHNQENNFMQKLRICGKQTAKINKRGFCQSKEKIQLVKEIK